MKFAGIVGIGLVLWGLVTLDWFLAGSGVFFVLCGFLFHLFKQRGAMTDGKVFASYRTVSQLIRVIRTSLEASDIDADDHKVKLAQGLFFLGMLDAASQSADMDDGQFLDLFKAIFADLDYEFDENYQSKLLLFHQSLATEHGAFPAIMKGGELFTRFANGNTTAPLAGNMLIEELIQNPNFPSSVEQL